MSASVVGRRDPSGKLNFSSKAVLHADGVDFSSGQSYKINMQELELEEELGKGQYGTVQRVFHKPTKVVMAMKEIHLELDQSKLNGILMELDILHRAVAPEIVEFYGAFFIESCVYYCMEYMDAGSLDKVYEGGVTDENVLARITGSMVRGLGFLKDTLQIMHRGQYDLLSSDRPVRSDAPADDLLAFYLACPHQMSSRPTCLSTRRVRSSCVTLECPVNWRNRSQRQTSGARPTWRYVDFLTFFLHRTQ